LSRRSACQCMRQWSG